MYIKSSRGITRENSLSAFLEKAHQDARQIINALLGKRWSTLRFTLTCLQRIFATIRKRIFVMLINFLDALRCNTKHHQLFYQTNRR